MEERPVLKWMKKYMYDLDSIRDDDVMTDFHHGEIRCMGLRIGDGYHMPGHARVWEQIEKQGDLLYYYLGVRIEYSYSNRYRYYNLYLPTDPLFVPAFFDIKIMDDRWAWIGINDLKSYAKTCNDMMREYLWWCVDNHKCCDNQLILPNADYCWMFNDILSDREKKIQDEEHKKKMEIMRKQAEEERLAKKAELERLEAEGLIKIDNISIKAVYDDYYYYNYECSVNDIARLGFQFHRGDKLYLRCYPDPLSIFSDEILVRTLEQGLREVKKAKDEKNDHNKLCDKIYIYETNQKPEGMILHNDCKITGLEIFKRVIMPIPEEEKDPIERLVLKKYGAKKMA